MITGKTLISLGYKQGKWFKEAIEYANDNKLGAEELTIYLDSIRPEDKIEPFATPVKYHKNIRAEVAVEESNVEMVLKTMNEVMR
ncbi:MAG: RNA-splicing ligase RtcB, partial [Chitinophagales bacterium]